MKPAARTEIIEQHFGDYDGCCERVCGFMGVGVLQTEQKSVSEQTINVRVTFCFCWAPTSLFLGNGAAIYAADVGDPNEGDPNVKTFLQRNFIETKPNIFLIQKATMEGQNLYTL